MKLKYYNQFIREQVEEGEVKDPSAYDDLKNDVKEMIEKSLKTSDKKTSKDFISAYLRDPDKTQIEGLINDSDIYEFYLKYRNNIDQILSETNFYDEKPSDMDSFSLYDYIIVGTKKALKNILEIIDKEGDNQSEETPASV
jgi:hypothetical protein